MKILQKLQLRVPPPILFLLCAGLMWGIAKIEPVTSQASNSPASNRNDLVLLLGALIAIIAILIALTAIVTMRKARTTINPLNPTQTVQIINWGIYSKSRNPMYLSLLLGLIVWALWLGALLVWFVLPLFIWLITILQIQPEEQILTAKFGQKYLAYKAKVRRWV